ncbi:MAG TPA: SRPBCC family protein [Actinomycetospora sp.]|nr:SRPBCC family protein [Actinomycetospora sp.]
MNTATRETTITADPTTPTILITREFDAPPDKVFRAHVEPDLVKRWLGPRSLSIEIDRYDAQTGGAYRYTHRDDDGEYVFFGSFHEVRPNERIVQTFTFEGFPDAVSLETMTLVDLGDGRTRLEARSQFDSFESRDGMLSSGMEIGVREGYEQLDELLAAG